MITVTRKGFEPITNEELEAATPVVEQIAGGLAATNSGIDAEDIAQEIWAHLIANWHHVAGREEAYLASVARSIGRAYCDKERYDFMFHSAQYVYTPDEVKALLAEAYFTDEAWLDAPRKSYGPIEGLTAGGIFIALLDLKTAMQSLSPADHSVIVRRFRDGVSFSNGAGRMAVNRAVEAMTKSLNRRMFANTGGAVDGVGSRCVVSNERAQAMTKDFA